MRQHIYNNNNILVFIPLCKSSFQKQQWSQITEDSVKPFNLSKKLTSLHACYKS